jgi:hypothetical protein
MLFGDRAKLAMLLCGLAFSALLMAQQSSVFFGIMSWTYTPMVNIRAQQKYKWGPVNTTTFVGVDNLFERKAVGSVIVNQASFQFYEPAMPLTALLGIQASLPF